MSEFDRIIDASYSYEEQVRMGREIPVSEEVADEADLDFQSAVSEFFLADIDDDEDEEDE